MTAKNAKNAVQQSSDVPNPIGLDVSMLLDALRNGSINRSQIDGVVEVLNEQRKAENAAKREAAKAARNARRTALAALAAWASDGVYNGSLVWKTNSKGGRSINVSGEANVADETVRIMLRIIPADQA